MCDALYLLARMNQTPVMVLSFENFHAKPYRRGMLPYLIPENDKDKRAIKSEPNRAPCFNLNPGNDHASNSSHIMPLPPGRHELLGYCDVGPPARVFQGGNGPRVAEYPRWPGHRRQLQEGLP